jgi:hypothetical protein
VQVAVIAFACYFSTHYVPDEIVGYTLKYSQRRHVTIWLLHNVSSVCCSRVYAILPYEIIIPLIMSMKPEGKLCHKAHNAETLFRITGFLEFVHCLAFQKHNLKQSFAMRIFYHPLVNKACATLIVHFLHSPFHKMWSLAFK